jgi:hypothetical protein
MSSTLIVAGLIGLLGASGEAASIVHSVTGPVRRAMRVLQASQKGRRSHRLRPTTPHELRHVSRAVDTAGYGAIAPDMTAAGHVVAGTVAVVGTTGPVDVSVVEEAHPVAVDATIGSARSGGADTGVAVIAPRGAEPAEGAAKAAEAVTAASTPAASSVATTRYAATTRYVAARSRALGPTTVLWHAVKLDRPAGAIGGACETTVCGSLVRVSTEQRWPVPARDVCPACSTLAH